MMNRPQQSWGSGFQSSPRHTRPRLGQTGPAPRQRYPQAGQTGIIPGNRQQWGQAGATGPRHRHPQPGQTEPGFSNIYNESSSEPTGPPEHSQKPIQSIFGLMSEADSGNLKPNSSLRPGKGILKNKNEVSPMVGDGNISAEGPSFQNSEKGNRQMAGNKNAARPFKDNRAEPPVFWEPQAQQIAGNRNAQRHFQGSYTEASVSTMQQTGTRGAIRGEKHSKDLHAIDTMEEEFLNTKNLRENIDRNVNKHAKETFKGEQYPLSAKETFKGEQYPLGVDSSNTRGSGLYSENDMQRHNEDKRTDNPQTMISNKPGLLGPGPSAMNMGGPHPMGFGMNMPGNPMGLRMNMPGPHHVGSNMNMGVPRGPRPIESNEMDRDFREPGPMDENLNVKRQSTQLNSNFMNPDLRKPINTENSNLQGPMIGGHGQSINSGPMGQNIVGFPAHSRIGGPMGSSVTVGMMSQYMGDGPAGRTMVAFPGQSMAGGLMSNSVAGGMMSHSVAGGLVAQSMAGSLMGPVGHSVVAGPGQPVFLQAAPVSIGYGGPTLADRINFANMQSGPSYNDNERSRSPGRQDRRGYSLSPERYGSGNMDDNIDNSGRDNDWLEDAIDETRARLATLQKQCSVPVDSEASGWRDIAIEETKKRLELLERQRGLRERSDSDDWRLKAIEETKMRIARLDKKMSSSARSRSRSRERRSGKRGGSADRDRNRDGRRRSRSRSRGRAGDRKGSSKDRMGSTGRTDKVKDPFAEGHEAYLEEQDRVWRDLKRTFKLSDRDKPRQPMFQEGVTGGFRCKDCKVTVMDTQAYGMHLESESHIRIVQLRAQEVLLKDTGDRRNRNRRQRSRSPDRRRRAGSLDRARRGGSRDRIRRSRSRERARERSTRGHSGDRDRDVKGLGDRGPEKNKDKKPAGNEAKAVTGMEKQRLKGPLKVDSIHPTGCKLLWDSGGKKRRSAKYTLHYRVVEPDKGDWQKLCELSNRMYVVEDLMPGTTYQFRVTLERPGENYVPEYSERVTTPNGVKVTIRNLGWSVTDEILLELFKDFDVKTCKITPTQQNNQFAEIEVGTTAEATRCEAEFNNTTFRDRIIHVKSETGLGKSERKKFLEEQKARFEEKLRNTNESFIENVFWDENTRVTTKVEGLSDYEDIETYDENFDSNTDKLPSSQIKYENVYEDVYEDAPVNNFEGNAKDNSQDTEMLKIAPANVKANKDVKNETEVETIDLTVEFDKQSSNKGVQKDKENNLKNFVQKSVSKRKGNVTKQTEKSNVKKGKVTKEAEKSNKKEKQETIDLTVEFDDSDDNEQTGDTWVKATAEDAVRREREEERRRKTEEWKKREPRVLLYEKLKGNEAKPLIGLEFLTEIQDYNPEKQPYYKCEVCRKDMIESGDVIQHCVGVQHKLRYLEKEEPFICKMLEWTTDKREKKEKVFEYAETIYREKGWGTVKLVMKENPVDFGREALSEPVLLPPPEFVPPPEPTEEEAQEQTTSAERIYRPDGTIYYQFDQLLKDERDKKRKNGENVLSVVGLKYLKEYIHPDRTDPPRYRCCLCEMNSAQRNVLPHLYGKKHRLNYIEKEYPDIYKKIEEITDRDEKGKAIDFHAVEIEKKIGLEKVEIVHSETTNIWDWAKKAGQKTAAKKINETVDAVVTAAKQTVQEVTETQLTTDNNVGQSSTTATEMVGIEVARTGSFNDADQGQFAAVDPDIAMDGAIVEDGTYMEVEESEETALPKKYSFSNRGWTIENGIIQEKLLEGIIIKTNRFAKFINRRNNMEPSKQKTMIGLSSITEYQFEDATYDPYYMCELCKSKISNRVIVTHVNSLGHRMNYMEKRNPDSDTLRYLKTNTIHKTKRAEILEKQVEKFVREDKHGKIKVMMELDTPEELLDVIVNRVEQQIAEKKKVAKEATEKMKQLEKGAIEKKKKGNKEGTEKRKQPEKGALEKTIKDFERHLPPNMTICKKCTRHIYKWDPHLSRCCTLCCGCTANKPCNFSRNLYSKRWKNIARLRSEYELSNTEELSSKAKTTNQKKSKASPRKGSSLKERQVTRSKVTDNAFVDQSSVERAVLQAYQDVQSGASGPGPEISSLLSRPAPQRPPRPGTPPPPEVMGSPRAMNEPFLPGMGPSGLMPVDQLVLASVGLPMNQQFFDAQHPDVGNMREPLGPRMGIMRNQMQSGDTRGEKRRDFDERSPDFTKRRRSFSPDRGGYVGERGYGDMDLDSDQGRDFDRFRGFDQGRDQDFAPNHDMRYDDDDDDDDEYPRRRLPRHGSPDRENFGWDEPNRPSSAGGRYDRETRYDREPSYDWEPSFDREHRYNREQERRPRSPWEESHFDDRFEPQQHMDRYSDDESPGRRSPTQQEIQELLNQANSRIDLPLPGQLLPGHVVPGQFLQGHQMIPGQLVPASLLQGQLLQGQFINNPPQMMVVSPFDQPLGDEDVQTTPERDDRPSHSSPRRGRDRPRGGDRQRGGERPREGGNRPRNRSSNRGNVGRGNVGQGNRDRMGGNALNKGRQTQRQNRRNKKARNRMD